MTLRTYVQAIKVAKANPETMFKSGLCTWWETSGAEIMEQFREGMVERINAAIPYSQRDRNR